MEENKQSRTSQYKYHAFISYRHADNKVQGRQWATWLHQAIETYEVPKDLVGKKNGRGDVIPARIYPIFRDEEELPAHADLGTSIVGALEQTNLLVVLCSPRAVASTYVADEIDYFKKLGGSDRIIAAMIDGEPNTSWDESKHKLGFCKEDECFPLPLQFEYGQDGNPTDKHAEPIAADFRINNDGKPEEGWTTPAAYREHLKATTQLDSKAIDKKVDSYQQQLHLMLLKIIAGILGVPLGELTQRDKEYQLEQERLKAKKLKQWLGVVAMLAIFSIGASVFAYFQKEEAQRQEQLTLDALKKVEQEKMKAELSQKEANKQKLIAQSSEKEAIKNKDRAEKALKEMRNTVSHINNEVLGLLDEFTPSYVKMGMYELIERTIVSLGEKDEFTRKDKISYATMLQHKAKTFLSSNHSSKIKYALSAQNNSVGIFTQLVESTQNGYDFYNLAQAHKGLGDIYMESRELEKALVSYLELLGLAKKIVNKEPENATFQTLLAYSYELVGEVFLQESNIKEAVKNFRTALKINKSLIVLEPANDKFRRQLSLTYWRIGKAYFRQGNIEKALTNYTNTIRIFKSLSDANRLNTGAKRNLSLAYNDVGAVYLKLNDLQKSLDNYLASIDVSRTLLKSEPTSTKYQYDLSISYFLIGDLFAHFENFPKALDNYYRALPINKKLVEFDSSVERYTVQVNRVYQKIAFIYFKMGDYISASNSMMTNIDMLGINVKSKKLIKEKSALLIDNSGKYLSWSWYILFTEKLSEIPKTLINVINHLPENNESTIKLYTNLAHAYLLSGDYDKAKGIYQKYKGFKFKNGNTWDKAIISDFKALEKGGITHPDFTRIAKEVFGESLKSGSGLKTKKAA